jgi:phosphorylcholine metabolism protein LicD
MILRIGYLNLLALDHHDIIIKMANLVLVQKERKVFFRQVKNIMITSKVSIEMEEDQENQKDQEKSRLNPKKYKNKCIFKKNLITKTFALKCVKL